MSQVDVTECQTADDVRKLAKRVLIQKAKMREVPVVIRQLAPIELRIVIEQPAPQIVPAPAPEPEIPAIIAAGRLLIRDIQMATVKYFNMGVPKFTIVNLLSSRRTQDIVWPRQIAMYICKQLTLHSLPEIGRRFAGRDHTTILHAVRKIERLRADPQSSAEQDYLGVLGVLRERGFTVPDLEEQITREPALA